MLHLSGHDRLFHAIILEKRDHLAQLADPDPRNILSDSLDIRIRFLLDSDNSQFNARPSGAVNYKKRKSAVPGD